MLYGINCVWYNQMCKQMRLVSKAWAGAGHSSLAKQTCLRRFSDVSVAAFSSSAKYVWVCFF